MGNIENELGKSYTDTNACEAKGANINEKHFYFKYIQGYARRT